MSCEGLGARWVDQVGGGLAGSRFKKKRLVAVFVRIHATEGGVMFCAKCGAEILSDAQFSTVQHSLR